MRHPVGERGAGGTFHALRSHRSDVPRQNAHCSRYGAHQLRRGRPLHGRSRERARLMRDFSLMEWRIERRREIPSEAKLVSIALALAVAILVCSLLFTAAGASPLTAFQALLRGSFGTWRAAGETLVKATPLIFTGLAA